MATRSIIVIAGVGNATGVGAATARLFAKKGYSIALLARSPTHIEKLAKELKDTGAEASAFPVSAYSYSETERAFSEIKKRWPNEEIRVTLWNAADAVWKPFLDHSEEDVRKVVETNVIGVFAFSRQSMLAFKDQSLDALGARGTMIFTGATASIRGNTLTSTVSASKFAERSLSQSLAKEFGKKNIHVSHAIIDGPIVTDATAGLAGSKPDFYMPPDFVTNEDIRLDPNSIAKTYLHLTEQHRSAWTWEIDLRSAHEKW